MPKRSRKPRQTDFNLTAADIVRIETQSPAPGHEKNAAAGALGHLGGKKGGKARAAKLSAEERREITRNAASIRWRQKDA